MNRSDARKEVAGAARSPGQARRDEDPIASEHVSREKDDPIDKEEGEDSSMGRSRGAAHAGAERHMREERTEESPDHEVDTVKGGRAIKHVSVDADHVIGAGGPIGTKSAEGETDMASAKANRKEAMEPEREENEKAAMGRGRTVPTKNTMGHGERETVSKHTI